MSFWLLSASALIVVCILSLFLSLRVLSDWSFLRHKLSASFVREEAATATIAKADDYDSVNTWPTNYSEFGLFVLL